MGQVKGGQWVSGLKIGSSPIRAHDDQTITFGQLSLLSFSLPVCVSGLKLGSGPVR